MHIKHTTKWHHLCITNLGLVNRWTFYHMPREKKKITDYMGLKYPQIQMSLWLKVGGGWPLPSEWPLIIFSSKSELDLSRIQCNVSSFPLQSKTKHLLLLHDLRYWIHSTKSSRVAIQPMTYSHMWFLILIASGT